ncbi:MAG TPA: DEAD/DEAH box helicase, partial [Methanocorpusculum sp.]|nr:DEAD/DEAH box helicase [Methanocorpusculum sp.]
MNVFQELHPSLQETLITGLGWDMLRPVQEKACEAVFSGCDIIILAPTAGGKTEAAFLPVLDTILKHPSGHLSAVYVSPLKALINDQTDRIIDLGKRAGLETAVQHGDVSASERWNFSISEPDILLTTPESLEVLLSSPDSANAFSHLRFIIVDEIHAFVESSRGVHLKCLIDRLTHISCENPKRIGLSATVGNPESLLAWFSAPDRKKTLVSVPAPPSKKQFTFILERDFHASAEKTAAAVQGKKALIFVDSRSFAERLYQPLSELLPQVYLHHSAVSSSDRKEAEDAFSADGGTCVICTSTMELGIDIGNLDLVVNFGPPLSASSFLQRLGRTGRRGNPAEMVFILRDSCELLTAIAAVETAAAHKSECLTPPKCPYDVLIQQLFLLIKSRRAVSESALISALHSMSPFSDIPEPKLRYLLRHLTETGYLFRDGNLIQFGTRAESEFGHANWKMLLSVLSDSGGYTAVLPDGTVVGTLDPRFVAGDAGKVFSFTGKTWRLLFRDDVHRRALIEPSAVSRGLKHPFWGGAGGSARVSRLVAESAGDIISRGHSILPLPPDVRE